MTSSLRPGRRLQRTRFRGSPSLSASQDRVVRTLLRDRGVDVGGDSVVPRRHGALDRATDAGEVRRRPAKNHVSGRGAFRTQGVREERRVVFTTRSRRSLRRRTTSCPRARHQEPRHGGPASPGSSRCGPMPLKPLQDVRQSPNRRRATTDPRDAAAGAAGVRALGPTGECRGWIGVDSSRCTRALSEILASVTEQLPTSKTGAAIRKQAPSSSSTCCPRADQPRTAR